MKKLDEDASINIFDDVYIKDDMSAVSKTRPASKEKYLSLKQIEKENKKPFFNIGNLNKTNKFSKIVIGENIKQAASKAHNLRVLADPTDPEHDEEKEVLLKVYSKKYVAKEASR